MLNSGLHTFKLNSDPFVLCFATPTSFTRSSIRTRATKRYLPPSVFKIETSPSPASNQSLPNTSIMLGLRVMRGLLSPLSGACASILRSASARIAERFCQLFAPVVEVSLLGDVIESEGIGARLARDGRAMPDNDIVAARTLRLEQGFSDQALLFLRLRQGGL
jgi:hypothetical protein